MNAGAWYDGNGRCTFIVWAPKRSNISVKIEDAGCREVALERMEKGYFKAEVFTPAGTKYFYICDGQELYPDPASHFQPEGVHEPSQVIDHDEFKWSDSDWRGLPWRNTILYELHVGTFTREGNFEGVISRLDYLRELGINTIELMPVSQFPGERNWGYDGVYPYAVQNSYGGPDGLKRLVDACHKKGIAVFLDVVYNHLGPEGNYLHQFGPYFTKQYQTPWGDAINFDGEWSDGVKEYFIENILFWYEKYHVDGLRLDAIHAIFDNTATSFWELLYEKKRILEQKLGRSLYLTAESDLNNPKVVRPTEIGGYGFNSQWLDDFHHALYVMLDKNGKKMYEDFGGIHQLAKAYKEGFVHSGDYVKFRKRKHGSTSAGMPGDRFIVFTQNHDQVGNRVGGERLCMLVDQERVKVAAAAVMLAPYIPLLFMGEEYGADTPFHYFVSHSDKELINAVREGRKKEFEDYKWETEPLDPQDEATFRKSILQWQILSHDRHRLLFEWYKALIALRSREAVFHNFSKNDIIVNVLNEHCLLVHRRSEDGLQQILFILNFSDHPFSLCMPDYSKEWRNILNSHRSEWVDSGEKEHFVPYLLKAGDELHISGCSVLVYKAAMP